ncbi:hypothetical protein LZ32DRAFT_667103 [Colletotrichum eremochloae]|nr:hypothetical protein LZ32DRAFT_667103 [Colletotrichum eremochloae]
MALAQTLAGVAQLRLFIHGIRSLLFTGIFHTYLLPSRTGPEGHRERNPQYPAYLGSIPFHNCVRLAHGKDKTVDPVSCRRCSHHGCRVIFNSDFWPLLARKKWIGFQALVGIGVGISMEVALVTSRKNVPLDDIPSMVGPSMFFELAGGTVFVSAGEAIFANSFLASLRQTAPSLDGIGALQYGALGISEAFGNEAPHVIDSYMVGSRHVFVLVLTCAAITAGISLVVGLYEYMLKRKRKHTHRREDGNE